MSNYLGPELPLGALQKPPKRGPKEKKPLPPPKKRITTRGKVAVKWLEVRNEWLKANLPTNGYYMCALCGDQVAFQDVTLDHIIPRSRAPHLRYEFSNLQPAHLSCNTKKGSRVI